MSDFKFVMPTGTTDLAGSAIADFCQGGTISDTVSLAEYGEAYFIFNWGVATGGTATPTFTVIPASDAANTATTTAIPFEYKRVSSTETNTAWTTSSSLTATAGSHQAYVIKVRAQQLPEGYPYCYVNVAETVDDPIVGGCIIMMASPRYNEATLDAVTA